MRQTRGFKLANGHTDQQADALARKYVELVRPFPQVRSVLLERTSSADRLWTVIKAEPFDDSEREAIYRAELDALQDGPEIDVGFRLVNLTELPPQSHRSVLPTGAKTLFRR